MASKPILFSTPMVQAILDDRKSMTRRVIKDKDITNNFDIDIDGSVYAYIDQATGDSYPPTAIAKYQVGDILWVRETWQDMSNDEGDYVYLADGDRGLTNWSVTTKQIKWRPSIFMPREAARIFLRVTNVRVERLQDITAEDVIREGIKYSDSGPYHWHVLDTKLNAWINFHFHDEAFKRLWDSINAKRGYGWETNPWVWVYEFERVSEDGSSKDE